MKKIILAAAAVSLLGSSSAAFAIERRNAYPSGIHVDNNRPCVFFYLKDVPQPDPAAPSAEAFAIPKSHPAFAELVAMLLTARAAGLKIGVFTTGGYACGQAEVNLIVMEGVAG